MRQIHFLPARQVEQQVERAFPAIEFEIERGIIGRRGAWPLPIVFRAEQAGLEGGFLHQASASR